MTMCRGPAALLVSLSLGTAVAWSGAVPVAPPGLRLLTQVTLPDPLKAAVDLRWASDRSLYLALSGDGTVEAPLEPLGGGIRELIPGRNRPGGLWVSWRVAAARDYLVVGAPIYEITWRRFDAAARVEEAFEFVQGLDAQGERVAVVGARRDDKGAFSPDGAIAWLGSLHDRQVDLRPILYASTGPGARAMNACGSFNLGAARFQADGSLVVVAGVQPGIARFDPAGKLLHTWDTTGLIDTDCASLTAADAKRLAADYDQRLAWINLRRTVDDVLVLPQGPALLVRSVEQRRARWQLKVLRPDGTWSAVDVPIRGDDANAHLRGDLRAGKLALLLFELGMDHAKLPRSRLLTLAFDG